jgi:hypothetical protein
MLTDDQIIALLDGCVGVTPGPWDYDYGDLQAWPDGEDKECVCIGTVPLGRNIMHIARCDPGTIAELCERLLSAEARVKVLESVLAQYPNEEHAAVLEAGR